MAKSNDVKKAISTLKSLRDEFVIHSSHAALEKTQALDLAIKILKIKSKKAPK